MCNSVVCREDYREIVITDYRSVLYVFYFASLCKPFLFRYNSGLVSG